MRNSWKGLNLPKDFYPDSYVKIMINRTMCSAVLVQRFNKPGLTTFIPLDISGIPFKPFQCKGDWTWTDHNWVSLGSMTFNELNTQILDSVAFDACNRNPFATNRSYKIFDIGAIKLEKNQDDAHSKPCYDKAVFLDDIS